MTATSRRAASGVVRGAYDGGVSAAWRATKASQDACSAGVGLRASSAPRTPRTAAPPASSIFDALYDRAFSYAAKKERLRVERSESAMEECTFTPHINRGAPTRWEKLENLRTAEPPVEAAE